MPEKYFDKVLTGDCLSLFDNIPDDSIDVTFADPPFNLKKKYNSTKDSLALQEYLDWCTCWIEQMVRVTKPTGSIFIHNIPKWLTYYVGFLNKFAHFKHWISWDAPSGPMGKSLQPSHYGILYYTKKPQLTKFYEIRHPHKRCRKCNYLHKDYGGKKAMLHPFGPLVSDVWTDIHRIKHNKYRDDHPCQLPIHLLERLILMASDEGDVVLDPFLGTGTSALAAKRMGRRFIGFELDSQYAKIAQQKLNSEYAISKIKGAWVSMFLNEIVTLRDCDWPYLSDYYLIPKPLQKLDSTAIAPRNGVGIKKNPRNGKDIATLSFLNQLCECE